MFFRVADICRNVKINVVGDGKVIHSIRKPKVAPGEMESLPLKGPLFEGVSELSLQLEEIG